MVRHRAAVRWMTGSAAVAAVILLAAGGAGRTELLTRGEVDDAVGGCKWWYCAQSAGDVRVRNYAASTTHPGYSVQETDNLPAAEQQALAPYVNRMMGAFTSHTPVLRQSVSVKAYTAPPRRVSSGSIAGRMAAEAAASNEPVTITSYQGPQAYGSAGFYNLAQRSLHALTTPTAQLTNSEALGWGLDPSGASAPPLTAQDLSTATDRVPLMRVLPGDAYPTESQADIGVERDESRLAAARARLGHLRSRALSAGAPARTQSLAEESDNGGVSLTDVAEGGQSYVEGLEAKLRRAEERSEQAKKVVDVLHAPHAETFQVGSAATARGGLELAQKPDIVVSSPTGAAPFVFSGAPAAPSAYTFQGTEYPVQQPGNPYSSIYGAFQNYAPMQRWSEEDSAEHAYNLNRWRERILEAKIQQARLRKQLMAAAGPEAPPAGASGGGGGAPQAGGGGAGAAGGKGAKGGAKLGRDVTKLKAMLRDVAEETSSALQSLTRQVKTIALRDEEGHEGQRRAPPRLSIGGGQELRQRPQRALRGEERPPRGARGRGAASGQGAGGAEKGYRNLGKVVNREMGELNAALSKVQRGRHSRGVGIPRDSATGVVSLQLRGMGREHRRLKQAAAGKRALAKELKEDMEALRISRGD